MDFVMIVIMALFVGIGSYLSVDSNVDDYYAAEDAKIAVWKGR